MHDVLLLTETRTRNQFKIDYPYYGLFGSADVTTINNNSEVLYRCKLLNGTVIHLKKVMTRKWIDATTNSETPLSIVIGTSIDDFLKSLK